MVRKDRALLTLAMFSGVLGAAGAAVVWGLDSSFGQRHFSEGRAILVALVLGYPLTFIAVFFNTAIAAAAAAAMDGRRLSLGEALAVPARRIGQVALWALMASVVGFIVEQLASRLPVVGSIAARLFGLAWSLASLFVVPILALEGCSAPDCLRRSADVVKKRWGEGISGNVIITAWMVVALVPVAVLFGIAVGATHRSPVAQDAAIALGAVALVGFLALSTVVRQTFAGALYRYATTGSAQGPFYEGDLESPFKGKRGLKG